MMKRMICLILAAMMCLALLTACGSSQKKNPVKDSKPAADTKDDEPKIEDVLAAQLTGTWSAQECGDNVEVSFRSGGKGQIVAAFADAGGVSESFDFTWSVDGYERLTVVLEENETTYRHAENAVDGKETSWFIDGDTLYFQGIALTKQG